MFKLRLKLSDTINEENAFRLSEGLLDVALSGSAKRVDNKHDALWIIEWLMADAPDIPEVIARLSLHAAVFNLSHLTDISPDYIEIEEISEDENWLEKSYAGFEPFSIGSFFVHGSHFEGEVPDNKIPLQIDAATAFGSGEHETTKGCMLALFDLNEQGTRPKTALDMGTGSGILALAASKMWGVPVLAVDNDAESIRVTRRHAGMNNVKIAPSSLSTAVGDGFFTPEASQNKPYDLIFANILAGPVIEMAPSLARVLDENGFCILSGMLVEQSDLVLSAYEGEGLTYCTRYDIGEWTTLVMQKSLQKTTSL